MEKVRLLIGDHTSVLIVFESLEDAYACKNACDAHERRRPEYPGVVVDTPENDAAFAAADVATERWGKRHPGGRAARYYSEFAVATRTVRPAKRSAA